MPSPPPSRSLLVPVLLSVVVVVGILLWTLVFSRDGDGPTRAENDGRGGADAALRVVGTAVEPRSESLKRPGDLTIRLKLAAGERGVKDLSLAVQSSLARPTDMTGDDAATLAVFPAKLDGPGRLEGLAQTMDFRVDCVRGATGTRYNQRAGYRLTLGAGQVTTLVVRVAPGATFPGVVPALELESPALPNTGIDVKLPTAIKPVAGVSLTLVQDNFVATYGEDGNTDPAGQPLLAGELPRFARQDGAVATGLVFGQGAAGQRVELVARTRKLPEGEAEFAGGDQPAGLGEVLSEQRVVARGTTDKDGGYRIAMSRLPAKPGDVLALYARTQGSSEATAGASCPASVIVR